MKKQYFVSFGSFANVYSLRFADNPAGVNSLANAGYTRITRAEAVRLARAEREREKYDRNNAGYASNCILPYNVDDGAYCMYGNCDLIQTDPRVRRGMKGV